MTIFRSTEKRKRDPFQPEPVAILNPKEHNLALMLQILSPFSKNFFSCNTYEK
jgi:hypothetical protein